MNQGPQLRPARIVNKHPKDVPTGRLYIFTLEFQDTDDLPTDWSTFSDTPAGMMYNTVNEGEMWTVSVTTAANMKKPGEVHHNITEFVEILEESDRPKPIKPDIPQDDSATVAPYPPDEAEPWMVRRVRSTSVNSLSIEVQVALKAATDIYLGRLNEPQLYNPETVVDDVLRAARRFQIEHFGHPCGEDE